MPEHPFGPTILGSNFEYVNIQVCFGGLLNELQGVICEGSIYNVLMSSKVWYAKGLFTTYWWAPRCMRRVYLKRIASSFSIFTDIFRGLTIRNRKEKRWTMLHAWAEGKREHGYSVILQNKKFLCPQTQDRRFGRKLNALDNFSCTISMPIFKKFGISAASNWTFSWEVSCQRPGFTRPSSSWAS